MKKVFCLFILLAFQINAAALPNPKLIILEVLGDFAKLNDIKLEGERLVFPQSIRYTNRMGALIDTKKSEVLVSIIKKSDEVFLLKAEVPGIRLEDGFELAVKMRNDTNFIKAVPSADGKTIKLTMELNLNEAISDRYVLNQLDLFLKTIKLSL